MVTSKVCGSLRQASGGDARLPSVEDLEGFARQMLGFEISYSEFLVCFFLVARKTIKERFGWGKGTFFFQRLFFWVIFLCNAKLTLSLSLSINHIIHIIHYDYIDNYIFDPILFFLPVLSNRINISSNMDCFVFASTEFLGSMWPC